MFAATHAAVMSKYDFGASRHVFHLFADQSRRLLSPIGQGLSAQIPVSKNIRRQPLISTPPAPNKSVGSPQRRSLRPNLL
jgi:hypothetical protein